MADDPAVQLGETVREKPDSDDNLGDGDDHDVLAEGGGEVAKVDDDRARMGESNDDQGVGAVNSDENLEVTEE